MELVPIMPSESRLDRKPKSFVCRSKVVGLESKSVKTKYLFIKMTKKLDFFNKMHGKLLSLAEKLVFLHQTQINCCMKEQINRLKVVLVEQQRTNKWLAEQLGKDPATVSKWCTNSVQPDVKTLLEIARHLNVDVKELLNSSKS